jgi:bacterioferritin-associated ferredoxin
VKSRSVFPLTDLDLTVTFNFKVPPMLVCLCHPTSDADIRSTVNDGARSVEEVGIACGAGTGCGACHQQIAELIDGELATRSGCSGSAASSDCSERTFPVRSPGSTQSREAA